jgi:hypothetical protein
MIEQSKKVADRKFRAWTKVTALTYMGAVNRGHVSLGLAYWSASDFLGKFKHSPKHTSLKQTELFLKALEEQDEAGRKDVAKAKKKSLVKGEREMRNER